MSIGDIVDRSPRLVLSTGAAAGCPLVSVLLVDLFYLDFESLPVLSTGALGFFLGLELGVHPVYLSLACLTALIAETRPLRRESQLFVIFASYFRK